MLRDQNALCMHSCAAPRDELQGERHQASATVLQHCDDFATTS
jgi:hypothetical protein